MAEDESAHMMAEEVSAHKPVVSEFSLVFRLVRGAEFCGRCAEDVRKMVTALYMWCVSVCVCVCECVQHAGTLEEHIPSTEYTFYSFSVFSICRIHILYTETMIVDKGPIP
jgi:hypothetical protein